MRRTKAADRKRKRILDEDELRAVWAACEEAGTFGAIVRMLLLTAQRRQKVTEMRWDDIVDGEWRIAAEPREKSHAGTLKLPELALDIIEAQPRIAENPFVFAGRRRGRCFNSFGQHKDQLQKMLPSDMPPWTLHDLRRTARSMMSRAGVRPDIAERILGHAIPGVEGVYDRYSYAAEKAHALNELQSMILSILNPPDCRVIRLSG